VSFVAPNCPDNLSMLEVLRVTFPFFALVLCGYAAARKGLLPLEAIPGLNGFVLFFALPCMLFRFGASTPIAQLLDAGVFVTYLGCALVMVAFSVAISLNERIRWNDASLGALVAAFPNTGFMGVPLLVALLGPEAAGPTIVTIIVDMVITSSLCVALSRMDAAGEHGAAVAARKALAGVVRNPMPWAISLGGIFSFLNLELIGPLNKTVALLADAASPVALFTIGAVLARAQMLAHERPHGPLQWADYVPISLIKLLLHPVLVFLVGGAAVQMGAPIDPFALMVMVLVAALPSASNVSLLAERLGADNGRIARIILVTTSTAFFTFSGAVALLMP
jgi:malonate transporter and related proteins